MYRSSFRQLSIALFCFFALCGANELKAIEVVAVDTFGPLNGYSTASAVIVGDNTAVPIDGNNLEQAIRFTVPVDIELESLLVAVRYLDGTPNRIDFHIRVDELGLPGSILESVSISNVSSAAGGELRGASFASHSPLNAGTNYWITATAPGGTNEGTMLWQMQPATSPARFFAFRNNANPWQGLVFNPSVGVFRITGTTIPEPQAVTLILGAVTTLIGMRPSKRWS